MIRGTKIPEKLVCRTIIFWSMHEIMVRVKILWCELAILTFVSKCLYIMNPKEVVSKISC